MEPSRTSCARCSTGRCDGAAAAFLHDVSSSLFLSTWMTGSGPTNLAGCRQSACLMKLGPPRRRQTRSPRTVRSHPETMDGDPDLTRAIVDRSPGETFESLERTFPYPSRSPVSRLT